jgi:hypothetical protein
MIRHASFDQLIDLILLQQQRRWQAHRRRGADIDRVLLAIAIPDHQAAQQLRRWTLSSTVPLTYSVASSGCPTSVPKIAGSENPKNMS